MFAAERQQFLKEYGHIRSAEGRGADDAEYYTSLPYVDRARPNADQWAIRARSFEYFERRILPATPLDILDLGAGNCWLSYRLAQRDHRPVAIDIFTDSRDGLGAATRYPVRFGTVEAEFDFVSACDGSKHTVKTYGEAMDSGDKATNKAMSAAYKYAAFQTFCIPTEGDNDADAQTHEPKGYVVQPPAPAPAPAPPPAPAPTGTVLIERVDTSPTKNPNVTKYLITDSNGQTFSTIKAQLGSLCEQLCQEQLPVTIESKQTKWGHDLVAVHPTERVIQIQHDVHSEPVTDKDIPF